MAAHLLGRMQDDLKHAGLGPGSEGRCDHDWLMRVQALPKQRVAQMLAGTR